MNDMRKIVKFRSESALPTSLLAYNFLIRGKEIMVIVDRNITSPQRIAEALPFSTAMKAMISVKRTPEYKYIFSHESQPFFMKRSASMPLRKYPAAAPVKAYIMNVPDSALSIRATSLIQGPDPKVKVCEHYALCSYNYRGYEPESRIHEK